jgi:hypothetical protein
MYVGMLNSLCFSIICEAENMQSMQDLPFLNPFCSSNSKTDINTLDCNTFMFRIK